MVIVLEDLRWADGDTVELVEYLADNVSGLPVLLVLTRRDSTASTALEAARRWRNSVCNHLSPAGGNSLAFTPRSGHRRSPQLEFAGGARSAMRRGCRCH